MHHYYQLDTDLMPVAMNQFDENSILEKGGSRGLQVDHGEARNLSCICKSQEHQCTGNCPDSTKTAFWRKESTEACRYILMYAFCHACVDVDLMPEALNEFLRSTFLRKAGAEGCRYILNYAFCHACIDELHFSELAIAPVLREHRPEERWLQRLAGSSSNLYTIVHILTCMYWLMTAFQSSSNFLSFRRTAFWRKQGAEAYRCIRKCSVLTCMCVFVLISALAVAWHASEGVDYSLHVQHRIPDHSALLAMISVVKHVCPLKHEV